MGDKIIYSRSHVVGCHEVDAGKALKPVAFMNIAQNAAHINSTDNGFGYCHLAVAGNAWVISRARVVFLDTPLWDETVTVETWARKDDGLFSMRDFEMKGSDGRVRVAATTTWIVMNVATRRVERLFYALDSQARLNVCPSRNALGQDCPRLRTLSGCSLSSMRRVCPSDMDYNLHANNAKYLEWAEDALEEPFRGRQVVEFTINFNSEARLGDEMGLWTLALSEDACHIEGRRGDTNVFVMEIKFRR